MEIEILEQVTAPSNSYVCNERFDTDAGMPWRVFICSHFRDLEGRELVSAGTS